jgi:glycosyltransferase involved in cell wall biosynthesis
MHDILIFVDEYAEKLKRKLDASDIKKGHIMFLTLNEETFLQLQATSYHVFFLEDILKSEDVRSTDKKCIDFIQLVFGGNDHFPFRYKNIPLGCFISFYLIPYFMRIFRYIICTDKALSYFHYERIIVAGAGNFSEAVRNVLSQKGVSFESWFGGRWERFLYALEKFRKGMANLWVAHPLRELFVEPAQNFLVLLESYLWKMKAFLTGRSTKGNPARRYFVLSADHHTYGIYDLMNKNMTWDFIACGFYYRFRKTAFKNVAPLERSFKIQMALKTVRASICFLSRWLSLKSDDSFHRKFEFMGINYWNTIKKLIKYNMLVSFPRLFLDHLIALEAFKAYPHSVLVLSDDQPPYFKTIIHAARQRKVKSLVIQHGVLGGINGRERIHSDFYAAWGPRALDWFKANADSSALDKIYITGSARYDDYSSHKNFEKRKILDELRLPQDKKIILIFTEWSQDFSVASSDIQDMHMIDAVVNTIERLALHEKCHIVIKPHPTADPGLLRQYCTARAGSSTLITIIPSHIKELLYVAEICVGAYSSCILEAMFFEKPSIVFDRISIREFVPYVSRGAALGARNEDEMAIAVETLLHDKEKVKIIIQNQKKYIAYAIYKLDGKSSERVCKLIEKVMEGEEKIPQYVE